MLSRLLITALVLGLLACSFVHTVWVENRTTDPVTIAYKLNALDKYNFISPRPGVLRKQGKESVVDTTTHINPADSVVTITLAPGERAAIARCMNCTYENMSDGGAGYTYQRMNLEWFKVTRRDKTTTYTPVTLMQLVSKKKTQQTLFVIGEDV